MFVIRQLVLPSWVIFMNPAMHDASLRLQLLLLGGLYFFTSTLAVTRVCFHYLAARDVGSFPEYHCFFRSVI